MTSILFEAWLRKLDIKMRSEKRKIALLLDNFSGHTAPTLKNVKIFFLLPNTTSLVQPRDAGIIRNLKFLLNALKMLKLAWTMVDKETISHCYLHVGFHSLEESQDLPPVQPQSFPLWNNAERAGLIYSVDWNEFVDVDEAICIGLESEGSVLVKLSTSLLRKFRLLYRATTTMLMMK